MMQQEYHVWAYEGHQHAKMIEARNKRDLAGIMRDRRTAGRYLGRHL